ncbi:HNH endonuclease [Dehalococcoidales bacterium]|nr:HNH endonuclease [Dehalococcoidales bacterium]
MSEWDNLRYQCYERDDYTCRICASKGEMVHAHHIIPKSAGGKDELDNLETLCGVCHAMMHGLDAPTAWLFGVCVQQLGVPVIGLDEEGNFSFNAELLKGLKFKLHKELIDIKGFKATILLPVARVDKDGNIISQLPEGFLEKAVSLWQEMCIERLEDKD